jgi:hypothetical protein
VSELRALRASEEAACTSYYSLHGIGREPKGSVHEQQDLYLAKHSEGPAALYSATLPQPGKEEWNQKVARICQKKVWQSAYSFAWQLYGERDCRGIESQNPRRC